MDDKTPMLDSSVALWPGLVAALLCGALALRDGVGVAAGVAGLLALPMGVASLAGASLGKGEARDGVPAAVAVLLSGGAMAVLGALLKANTHHKALAGVTFALVALGVVLGGLALGARGRQLASRRGVALGVVGLAAALALGLALRGGVAGLIDVVLVLVVIAAGALAPLRPSKALGGAAVALVTLGLLAGAALGHRPEVASKIQARSVIASGVLVPLGG